MMKSWLISVLVVLVFVFAYYTDLFALLASEGALITALILVSVMLLLALKVLGNPFRKADDDDKKEQ